jgi:hypothetical protein
MHSFYDQISNLVNLNPIVTGRLQPLAMDLQAQLPLALIV